MLDDLDLLEAAIDGRLDATQADWDPRPSLGVVMAAEHYPADPRTGDAIHGLDAPIAADAKVFHAGTTLERGMLAAKKPGTGIPARRLDELVGRRARSDIAADTVLKEDDLA